jgi:lipoprotein-anchoring transpeptidase ErfK/SrfK
MRKPAISAEQFPATNFVTELLRWLALQLRMKEKHSHLFFCIMERVPLKLSEIFLIKSVSNWLKIRVSKAALFILLFLFASCLLAEEAILTPTFQPSLFTKIQISLDRKGYSPGEIDGTLGRNTQKALAIFQKLNSLKPTGKPDPLTLKTLMDDAPAVVYYTIDEYDVAGPFSPKIPRDLLLQAKLPSLEYTSPMELLSEKFHINPALLRKMNPRAKFKQGEMLTVPNVTPLGDVTIRRQDVRPVTVTVSDKNLCVTVTSKTGDFLMYAPVTLGMKGAPLPIGTWAVDAIEDYPFFHYNPKLMVKPNPKHKGKDGFLKPGPNNPVGIAWIDINVSHLGMHGTSAPEKIGHRMSNGCIRMTNWDVFRLATLVEPGTPVVFVK